MRLLWRFLKPYTGITLAIIVALGCNLSGILLVPTILANMINTGISTRNLDVIFEQSGWMLLCALVSGLAAFIANFLCAHLATRIGRDIRNAVYDATLKFSTWDFEQFGTGSMITRTLGDITVIQQGISMTLQIMAPVPLSAIIGITLATSIDPYMGLLLFCFIVMFAILAVISVKRASSIFEHLQGFIDRINVRLRETITGVRVIRAFGKELPEKAKLDKSFSTYAESAIKINWIFATLDSFAFLIMNLAEVAIIWLGGERVGAHAMQIASISACVQYAMLILFFIMMAQMVALHLPRSFVCLERCREVLEYQPSIIDGTCKKLSMHTNASANILTESHTQINSSMAAEDKTVLSFRDVSFKFADASEYTLSHINFSCKRGTTTAIIGQTGSGKSTIAQLVMRLHDVSEGAVELAGVDVRGMTQAALRQHISYVPQKPWLFSGTIADNLHDGKPEASQAEMWHALAVGQADFVHELPLRLDTYVSQGATNFSGGQRQRLAIARALIKPADLYMFDDSFSALDFKTDAALRKALLQEINNAAVLLIAQRISTIVNADQIIVLKDGRIAGLGTHQQLIQSCAVYQDIANSQLKAEELTKTLSATSAILQQGR